VNYSIEFGGVPQDVTITTFGMADADGLIGFVRDLVANPRFRPGMLILVDHMSIDASKLTGADVRAQAGVVVGLSEKLGPSKVAIVVPTPLTFGYARMYEHHAAETQLHSRVFYSRRDALAWLESERSSAESQTAAPPPA
jgi:hypothetical protein